MGAPSTSPTGSVVSSRVAPHDNRCPRCGSFLDVPRRSSSGALARKCSACCEWHPFGSIDLHGNGAPIR